MYYACDIKFNDTGEEFSTIVKTSLDIVESEDDKIFFYCNGEHELKEHMKPDNGEDFTIINMVGPFANINEID